MYNRKIFKQCFFHRGIYWYKNLRNVPSYFRRIRHLVKHGYDEYAIWDTYSWFIDTMKGILVKYRKNRHGTPILIENYPYNSFDNPSKAALLREKNNEMWNDIIDTMINQLDDMEENNPKYNDLDYEQLQKNVEDAKQKFFELFSRYFYNLWD